MSICSFVSSQYIASPVERSAELNTNIIMTVLFGGMEGRVWAARVLDRKEELARRKSGLRTGPPGLMPWQSIKVLGRLHWGCNKSQHL